MQALNFEKLLSDNANRVVESIIREILEWCVDPEIISVAGGLPSPTTFDPSLKSISNNLYEEKPDKFQQYSLTVGLGCLRQNILDVIYSPELINVKSKKEIGITAASQQGLEIIAKMLINPGDRVIVGRPSYLGALGSFRSFGANFIGVPLDKEGMRADILEQSIINALDKEELIKFVYTVPDFQNPSAITMSMNRRNEIIEIVRKYNLLLVEDSPYRDIDYEGITSNMPFLQKLAPERTILLGTTSKTLAPGYRIGWFIAPKKIRQKMSLMKQSMDLCTSTNNQFIVNGYLESGNFRTNLEKTRKLYEQKRDILLDALEQYFKPLGITWNVPKGGLFTFATCPEKWNIDTYDMLKRRVKQYKVAFVPGGAFDPLGKMKNTMRINFSFPTNEQLPEGIRRISEMIKAEMTPKGYNL